jgi:hypothetical protein
MWLTTQAWGYFVQFFSTGDESTDLKAVTIPLTSSGISLNYLTLRLRDSNGAHIDWLVSSNIQTAAGTRFTPQSSTIILNPRSVYSIELDPREPLQMISPSSVQAAYSQNTKPSQARPGWSLGRLVQGTTAAWPSPNWQPYNPNEISGALLISIEATVLLPEISVEYPLGTEITNNAQATVFEGTVVGTSAPARTYTIRNVGGAPLTGVALSLRGSNATDFAVGELSATNLAVGTISSFTVTFSPKSVGSKSARVEIANNDPDENPYLINLSGEGLSAADIAVFDHLNNEIQNNSSAILFPDTVACLCADNIPSTNSSSSKTYTVKNTGQVSLNITSITNTGINAADFEFSGAVSTNLAPNMTSQITIDFKPETGGSKETTLKISSNDPDENPFILTFRGFGIGTNVDSDGDGLNDAAEYCMSPLGFDWKIKQTNLVQNLYLNAPLAGLYLSNTIVANPALLNLVSSAEYAASRALGRSDVTSNPAAYGLYTSNSVMDLRMGGLMIQRQGTNAVVSFQPQTTTDLTQPFTNNGTTITHTIPMPGNKGFIRINAKPDSTPTPRPTP